MNPSEVASKNTKIAKIKKWLGQHKLSVIIISVAVLAAAAFMVTLFLTNKPAEPAKTITVQKSKPIEKYYSQLTGVEVPDEAATRQAVTAVMIENSPNARPQSGLKQAGVVYETVAEGGITRFIALFQQDKPQLIGPVRSLRIYYLDWAAPYQASIAHVGGSYNALQTVKEYRDIDQSFNAGSYWRASDRHAPHNMYTSFEKLDELNASKGYTESSFTSFKRVDGKPVEEPTANNVYLNFSSSLFNTSYVYDKESNTYSRFLAGEPHNDREGGQLTPNVIVAIEVTTHARGGSDPYEDLDTSGSGQAYVFQNGTAQEVTWQKADRDSPLQLVTEDGKPVELVRGQTWIAAITGRGSVSWE